MRTKIIAGNWKMNKTQEEAFKLLDTLKHKIKKIELQNKEIVIIPPAVYLQLFSKMTEKTPLVLGAQDCSSEKEGAFTGDLSASMLRSVGAEYFIVGHSERRKNHNEDGDLLYKKLDIVVKQGSKAIFCLGESIKDRNKHQEKEVVKEQLKEVVLRMNPKKFNQIVIAYEPVWAIGTGKTATSEQAQEMHEYIREKLADKFNNDIANDISIIYGGSVNTKNAKKILSESDIDGVLVGGASLTSDSFLDIIRSV